ncbi:hypothetical protein AB4589_05115 [Vibrio sp. 10N.222.49.A3]|uniref:hypothetical protein n=1 Tax=unclassified Vibrio TaxID=2614977 RepID=UPI00352F1312
MIKQKQKAVKTPTKFDVRTSMKAMLAFERLPTKVQRQIRIAVEELKRGHEFALRREKIENASRTLYSGRINKKLRMIYRYKDDHAIEIVGFVDQRENPELVKVRA